MEAMGGKQARILKGLSRHWCDVHIARPGLCGFLAINSIEVVDVSGNRSALVSCSKGRHTPVWNGQDDDVREMAAGIGNSRVQQLTELQAVFITTAPAILIVDADQE